MYLQSEKMRATCCTPSRTQSFQKICSPGYCSKYLFADSHLLFLMYVSVRSLLAGYSLIDASGIGLFSRFICVFIVIGINLIKSPLAIFIVRLCICVHIKFQFSHLCSGLSDNHSVTHSVNHSVTYTVNRSVTHSLNHSVTHSPSITQSAACLPSNIQSLTLPQSLSQLLAFLPTSSDSLSLISGDGL